LNKSLVEDEIYVRKNCVDSAFTVALR